MCVRDLRLILKQHKKDADESNTDESRAKRQNSGSHRNKENKENTRWSHVKISFDTESVKLESDHSGPTTAIGAPTVPPTIKIIGKEVSQRPAFGESLSLFRQYRKQILHSFFLLPTELAKPLLRFRSLLTLDSNNTPAIDKQDNSNIPYFFKTSI